MRKYNKDNHLRIIDNKIYLYNIDFSLSSNEDILDILLTDVADISFKECKFSNIDASNKIIKAPISFINCAFDGDMSCNDTEFCKAIYFVIILPNNRGLPQCYHCFRLHRLLCL